MRDELQRPTAQLVEAVSRMAGHADAMLAAALRALEHRDIAGADAVIEQDARVDRAYAQVQSGVLGLIAMHAPTGQHLRLLSGLLHVSLHVERMADYAVAVARTTKHAADNLGDRDLTQQLLEMGGLARQVGQRATRAFIDRDAAAARQVVELDTAVDRLNVGIFERLVRIAGDDDRQVEWAGRMIQLTRQLERYADHAVDIAEQVVFVSTAERPKLRTSVTTD